MQKLLLTEKNRHFLQALLDLATVIVILIIGYIYTQGIENALDIGLWDESSYLYRGLRLPIDGFPPAQDAPLYALWYYLLSFFQPDAIDLYFLNYKLMTVLPPLILFMTLRAYRVSRILSLVVSVAFLFSFANFPTWPKVSHFAILVLLCGFLLCCFFKNVMLQSSAILVTALLVSYIRPEFFLAFMCLGALLIYTSFRAIKSSGSFKSAVPLLAILLPCIILIAGLGQPTSSGKRSMVAFGQHYARNWVRWHNDERNPWTNWNSIVAADFGKAKTPGQALLKNPSAIAHHVFQNLLSLPAELGVMFIPEYPDNIQKYVAVIFGILFFAIMGVALIRRQEFLHARDRFHDNWVSLRYRAGLFILTLIPVLISVLVIAPRRHYLFILAILLAFGIITLLFRNTDQNKGYAGYAILTLLCTVFMLTTQSVTTTLGATSQPNLKTIRFLRTLNVTTPTNVLEAEGGYGIYVGDNYKRIGEYDKTTALREFLTQYSIKMVVVSDRLTRDERITGDPAWHVFVSKPAEFGFTQLNIPGTDERSLFVRNELITNQ